MGKLEGSAPLEDAVRESGSSERSDSEHILAEAVYREGGSIAVTPPTLCTAFSSASRVCSLSLALLLALAEFLVPMVSCCRTTYFLIPTFT